MNLIKLLLNDICMCLLGAFLLTIFLCHNYYPVTIIGNSMAPTLLEGDKIIVNRLSAKEIERFDIVLFKATTEKDFIKRVIGLPGDSIEYINNQLYINGILYSEPYLTKGDSSVDTWTTSFKLKEIIHGEPYVPDDKVFVLGDHRGGSTDSRTLGFIPLKDIKGRVEVIYWPKANFELIR